MNVDSEIVSLLKQEKKVTLGFSTGKDSLACALICRNFEIEYIPFYFFLCPDLEFVEKSITKYEKLLEIKIIQIPHPVLYDFLRHQDFQPPKMIEYLADQNLPKLTFEDLVFCHLDSVGDSRRYYDVAGVRASESFNRRMVFKKRGGGIDIENKKIYPIWDWKKSDVLDFLTANNIPFSDDYMIWNRSYDGMKYQFLFGVKKHYPSDWLKLLEYFPLLEAELFRYEQNRKYF
jgi:3'-phosphoadenosine 5'-phosphosulfate sulfotransferase (PAPS reductase)/FAD synthetase